MNESRASVLIGVAFSLMCAALLFLHLWLPNIKIDAISIALLVLMASPWILPLLKSLELPGGVKIELKDAKAATEKISNLPIELSASVKTSASLTGTITRAERPKLQNESFLSEIASRDPNLALVGFRIELEKRLRGMAKRLDIDSERRSLGFLIRELRQHEILSGNVSAGVSELVALGNQAAHGVPVTREAAEWVLDIGPSILQELDNLNDSIPLKG